MSLNNFENGNKNTMKLQFTLHRMDIVSEDKMNFKDSKYKYY